MVDVLCKTRAAFTSAAALLGSFWPSTCTLCSAHGASAALDLCAACDADLPRSGIVCKRCAEPLGQALICGACLRRPPRFDSIQCAFRYAYPIDHMIRALKYRDAVAQGRVLGELLAAHIDRVHAGPLPSMIVPVPLAQPRFQTRGYNQAIELAGIVARRLQIPLRTDLAVRLRHTREQADLKRDQRRKNVRGAFAIAAAVNAEHVAIIDDVVTTGSTANELARVLKRAGARRVELWAVAKAGRK